MQVSVEWLREYIDIEESAEELAKVLTAGGVEVAAIEMRNQGISESEPGGVSVAECFYLADHVLDLELYPNRPDCLAMVNVARELGSLLGRKPHLPKWAYGEERAWPVSQSQPVRIDEPDLCKRYAGLLVEDVSIGPSPQWMQNRLLAAGIRPISNMVDITNYCMLELGQPLHAFDAAKVQGEIRVRLAREGERLVTLDGADRKLDADMLLITDDSGPIAVAGVMGGLSTEITADTKTVFFESAHFAGASVRRTSRKLGLRSESSSRFEKGVNPHWCVSALSRVAELVETLGAGKPVGFTEQLFPLPKPPCIILRLSRLSDLIGVSYSGDDVRKILDDLNFPFRQEGDVFTVEIPSYRQDLKIEEDLIEEVARIIGYDKIPVTMPESSAAAQGVRTPDQAFRLQVRALMSEKGFTEAMTYSFSKKSDDERWGQKEQIALLNPLREELGVMRTSLLPGLLEAGARNASRRNTDFLFFEIGSVYLPCELPLRRLPLELPRLAGIGQGSSGRHWLSSSIPYDFFYMKGALDSLADSCKVSISYDRLNEEKYAELLHPGRSATLSVDGKPLGILGELYPGLDQELGLERAVVFEINLDVLLNQADEKLTVSGYPKYPGMSRDLSLVVADDVAAEAILTKIRGLGGELLRSASIFDVYTGDPVPTGHKSLAFHLYYQSMQRTLTEEEVSVLNSDLLQALQQEFGAERRK